MKPAYTLGPWRIAEPQETAGWGLCVANDRTIVARLTGPFSDTKRANACLIAAAPDLLASLQRCVELMNNGGTWTLEDQNAARASISKATGE